MIKRNNLLFSSLVLFIFFSFDLFLPQNILGKGLENSEFLKITPEKGDISTKFKIEGKKLKPNLNSKNVEYKFKAHDSLEFTDWQDSSSFKFKMKTKGTFRAHLLAKDSDGKIIEVTKLYKVFDKLPRQSRIYISNTRPNLNENVILELRVWSVGGINRKDWEVRWDFDGDGNFDTDFEKNLKTSFIYEAGNDKVYPVAEIKYSSSDSEKIRGTYIYPGKDIPKTQILHNKENLKKILKEKYQEDFRKKDEKFCEFCLPNLAQNINGNYKSIIQCARTNEVGHEVIFDVLVPPNIVSMRPDFEGNNSWNFDFKPKTHWWWTFYKPGKYEVVFQLKDIYGKTSLLKKVIEIKSPDQNFEIPLNPFEKEEINSNKNSENSEKIKNTEQEIENNIKNKEKEKKKKKKKSNNNNNNNSENNTNLEEKSEVKIKVKVSHRSRRVFEKFLFDASPSKGENLKYEWKNPYGKYPIIYGKKQLFYFEEPGEKIITLKIIAPDGSTDKIEIPITVKEKQKEEELRSLVPNLILGEKGKNKTGFNIRVGNNIPKPKFDTGMRAGF